MVNKIKSITFIIGEKITCDNIFNNTLILNKLKNDKNVIISNNENYLNMAYIADSFNYNIIDIFNLNICENLTLDLNKICSSVLYDVALGRKEYIISSLKFYDMNKLFKQLLKFKSRIQDLKKFNVKIDIMILDNNFSDYKSIYDKLINTYEDDITFKFISKNKCNEFKKQNIILLE